MTFQFEIIEEPVRELTDYSRIPIAFEVRSVLEVHLADGGLGGIRLTECPVAVPRVKDYDAFEQERPSRWRDRWNIANWGVISVFSDGTRIGGCVLAYDTPGVHKLEDRTDIAFIWDIRIAPEYRGKGIGGRLIDRAVTWAQHRRCRFLKVETQNTNVPACRFYANHGFTLGAINLHSYPELPDEVELIWVRELEF